MALIVSLCGTAALPASAAADCPSGNPTYNGSCGPPFTLPYWGDSAGWTDASQYSTIQLTDVLGKGRDQLIGRSSAGIEIWDFDTTLGQWRPAMDANGNQMILTEFGDPPPLTTANPTPPDTDWTKPQYYSTIQTGDVLGTGRPQIIGRSATGVIVYSYTPGANGAPGTWKKAPDTGAFVDAASLPAGWYQTIGTADLFGGGPAELWGIDSAFHLRVISWTGSGWKIWPSDGLVFPPGVAGNTLQPSPVIDGQQELWFEAGGMQALRWISGTGHLGHSSAAGVGLLGEPWFQALPYSATVRTAGLVGASTPVLVGRGPAGLTGYERGNRGWSALPVLSDLSDAGGFSQEKYWRTITYADLDGNGTAEVLARGPKGLVAHQLRGGAWQQMPGSLDLQDDPWGGDQAYYGTFRAGDIDGQPGDELIARGPYGIRTWFYDRPGQAGFGPYLPQGYASFPGSATSGQQAAYRDLNAAAVGNGVLTGNQTTVRDVWTATGTAKTDLKTLGTNLDDLRDAMPSNLAGNCAAKTRDNPPLYPSCTPPSSTNGYTAGEWTAVVNELASEIYDARKVVDFYTAVDDIRSSLFIGDSFTLPALGDKIGLAGEATATTQFDTTNLMSSIVGIASSLLNEADLDGASGGAAISSYIVSMIPSASGSSTSGADSFAGTYDKLEEEFATAVTEADAAAAALNFSVRSDRNLMRLVSALSQPGALWDSGALDKVGVESAGNQAFTLWVYKALLPAAYGRYSIAHCVGYPGEDTTIKLQMFSCSGPPPWPTNDAQDIPWGATNPVNLKFNDVEPLPQGGLGQSGSPCHEHLQGLLFDCAFPGPDPGIVRAVSGKVSTSCTYDPDAVNTPVWHYGCNLGVNSAAVSTTTPVLNGRDTWNFKAFAGTPIAAAVAGSGSATVAAAAGASAARRANAARGHVVRLAGTIPRPRGLRLRRATIAVDRLLSVPGGDRELVERRAYMRKRGHRTRRLGSIILRRSGDGRFRSRASGRRPPRIRVALTPRGRRSLAYRITASNVVIRRLSDVCGHGIAHLRLSPRPFGLTLRMRIRRPHRGSTPVVATSNFACRYERSGAVRGLRVARALKPPEPGRKLTVKLRKPARLQAGRRGTLTATVRNRSSRTAQDVYVYAVIPRGLRVVGSTPKVRRTRDQAHWRVGELRRHRSRTFRIRVVPKRASTGARCASVHVRAMLRRPARDISCIRVVPAGPRP